VRNGGAGTHGTCSSYRIGGITDSASDARNVSTIGGRALGKLRVSCAWRRARFGERLDR
jgi:hypothetical protein